MAGRDVFWSPFDPLSFVVILKEVLVLYHIQQQQSWQCVVRWWHWSGVDDIVIRHVDVGDVLHGSS